MAGLKDQLKGVIATPPVAEPEPTEPTPKAEPSPTGDGKDKKTERTAEEVRGELLRKMDKGFAKIEGMLVNQPAPVPAPLPAPPSDNKAKNFDEMSSKELESLRSTINWETVSDTDKAQFEGQIATKKAEETMDVKFQGFVRTQELEQSRQNYMDKAVALHPDLNDPTSTLYREVDTRLKQQSESAIASNPRAVFDLANEVAVEKGLTPKPRRKVDGKNKATNSRSNPVDSSTDEPEGMMSDDKRAALARAFERRGALPDGKKFDLEDLKEDEADIRNNLSLHINN